MKAHYEQYLNEILKGYSKDIKMHGKVLFMKHYSSFVANREELEHLVHESQVKCNFIYHAFKSGELQTPYEPILDWIKNYVNTNEIDVDELLDKAGAYMLNRSTIKSYIKNGVCNRTENIIASEIEYEQLRIQQSIIDIINYISKDTPLIIILHKIHNAQSSTIDLIYNIIKNKTNNISLIVGYNELNIVGEYMHDKWHNLISLIENDNLIVECGMDDGIQHSSLNSNFSPDIDDINEYIVKINNLIQCVAIEEAEFYVSNIYHTLLTEQLEISEQSKMRLLELYAYVAIYLDNMKVAFLMCKKISNLELFSYDVEVKYKYNYLIALIKVYDRQREQAYPFVDACREIAVNTHDKDKLFESEMLKYIAWFGGWRDVFFWDKKIDIREEFMDEARKRNQLNHLAYLYFFGFIGTYESGHVSSEGYIGCENSIYFKKGLELANYLDNKQCLVRAWQKQVIVASSRGQFDEIAYYYNKCLDIVREQNELEKEAQIFNGLGYNCIINERYDEANMYFKKEIDILIKTENTDFLMETIYNMSMNAIAVEDYEAVITYMKLVIKMLKQMKMAKMRLCNISKLYGILIISYIKLDRIYDAKLYLDKMKRVLRHILDTTTEPDYLYWEDDTFLYYMIEGMINHEEGSLTKSIEAFQQGLYLWTIFKSKQEYIFTLFVLEMADCYSDLQRFDERNAILDRGIEFCKKSRYKCQAEKLERYKANKTIQRGNRKDLNVRLSNEMLHDINDITAKNSMRVEIEEKSKALLFFESWGDLINKENVNLDGMVENAMATMQNTYNIDSILWIEVNKNQPFIKYSDKDSNITKSQAKAIVEYFKRRRRKVVLSRTDKAFDDNDELTGIFGKNRISSIIAIPIIVKEQISNILIVLRLKGMNFLSNINVFSEEDANIFRTTFRQLIDAINREMFRIRLEQSSVTDILTGLLNRQGMKKFLENQFNTDEVVNSTFTVLYMDLDNFKYCNDFFGHDIGDVVLVAFSKMLHCIVGDEGSIIRYGGDEFVIILPKLEIEEGIAIAEDIFDMLKKNMGFKRDIENSLHKDISVERQNRISCSIGIATGNAVNEKGVLAILKKADEALYKVKKTTKHDYMVWSEDMEN